MAIWSWLTSRKSPDAPGKPSGGPVGPSGGPVGPHVVTLSATAIDLRAPDGTRTSLPTSALRSVTIETNDTGPIGNDLWWQLEGIEGRPGIRFPQGTEGEEAVVDWLMGLPDFDHEQMIAAMSSTRNATFTLWRGGAA